VVDELARVGQVLFVGPVTASAIELARLDGLARVGRGAPSSASGTAAAAELPTIELPAATDALAAVDVLSAADVLPTTDILPRPGQFAEHQRRPG
jgi:hypothetical protein